VAAYLGTGKAFVPTMDEGDILLQLQKPPSIGLQRSLEMTWRCRRPSVRRCPVRHSIGRVGSDELGLDPMGLNETDLRAARTAQGLACSDKDALSAEIRKVMDAFPGLEFGFTQPIDAHLGNAHRQPGRRGRQAVRP
jgi:cobalt-zinc-cadmium resistance protein CzcA